MAADATHPDYDTNVLAWMRARDVFAGEDAVKAAGVRYLPRLDSQTDDEYLAYRCRAAFFNATARTADGFVGLIFRRDPTFKLPEANTGAGRAMANFLDDADMLGTTLVSYAKNVASEVVVVGRAGTLIDWEDEVERRAYAVLYQAEQIINWRTTRINGRNVLSLLVLREVVADGQQDEFQTESIEQLRVLRLVPAIHKAEVAAGKPMVGRVTVMQCKVEIWQRSVRPASMRNKRRKPEWVKVATRTPRRLGKPLPLIPFVFHGPRHSLPVVDKLPLADIISANLDHYRLNADYKHGLHFTALPTAFVSGFDKSASLRIGSSTAWVAETPDAKAAFLEFKGDGLKTFERAMDRDERHMAVLGTRMLESQKRVGESADAIELRQSGENSVLSAVSLSVSDSLTQMLRWVYWWNSTEATPEGVGEDLVLAQLNTDFGAKGLASDEISAIVAAWQASAISRETMFELFRKGEVLPAGRSNQEEARLLAGAANGPAPTANAAASAKVVNEPTQPEVVK